MKQDSNPMQLGSTVDARRLVIWIGDFSVLDVLDKNSVTGDPRQTFLNMAFMTYASWDFTADARGYSYGVALELYWDDWAIRYAQLTPPKDPNQLPLDFRFFTYFGSNLELEHRHTLWGLPGAVKVLGYRNQVFTGSFDDAISAFQANPAENAAACTSYNYGSTERDGAGPVLGSQEQREARDRHRHRASRHAGDRRVPAGDVLGRKVRGRRVQRRRIARWPFGAVARGTRWGRPFDVTGVGLGLSWSSSEHARYLALGGIDGFIGDGALRQAAEGVFEVFYSFNLFRAIWLTGDFQLLWNPGYNADRGGPLVILGARAHAEF